MAEMILSKCANTDEALELFKELPNPCCSSAFFFVDRVKAARIEASAEEYDITMIENDAVGCCMRPLSEKMKKYDTTLEWDARMTVNAIPRTKRMHELLKKHYGSFDKNIMMEIARDHGEGETRGKGICQHDLGAVTIGSFVARPGDLKVWICRGSPCKHEYEEFTLKR